jgi:hypothetical protein
MRKLRLTEVKCLAQNLRADQQGLTVQKENNLGVFSEKK